MRSGIRWAKYIKNDDGNYRVRFAGKRDIPLSELESLGTVVKERWYAERQKVARRHPQEVKEIAKERGATIIADNQVSLDLRRCGVYILFKEKSFD